MVICSYHSGVIIWHQPKQCIANFGKPLKITMYLHCFIPPNMGNSMIYQKLKQARYNLICIITTNLYCSIPPKMGHGMTPAISQIFPSFGDRAFMAGMNVLGKFWAASFWRSVWGRDWVPQISSSWICWVVFPFMAILQLISFVLTQIRIQELITWQLGSLVFLKKQFSSNFHHLAVSNMVASSARGRF